MTHIDAHDLARRGQALVAEGDLVHGRAMLLEAVELNPRIESAWLALVDLVNDPQDQLIALENAVKINPLNPETRERLRSLRRALDSAIAVNDPDDLTNDPFACLYCGVHNPPERTTCLSCKRDLTRRVPGKRPELNRLAIIVLLGAICLAAIVWIAAPLMAAMPATPTNDFLTGQAVFQALFTNVTGWSTGLAQALTLAFVARFVILALPLFGILSRFDIAYPAVVTVAILDLLILFTLSVLGLVSGWWLIAHVFLHGITLYFAIVSNMTKAGVNVRAKLELPKHTPRGVDLVRLGRAYQDEGKIALATLHYQKATLLDDTKANWFYLMGAGYARLGRYKRARRALRDALDLQPGHPTITAALREVEQRLGD